MIQSLCPTQAASGNHRAPSTALHRIPKKATAKVYIRDYHYRLVGGRKHRSAAALLAQYEFRSVLALKAMKRKGSHLYAPGMRLTERELMDVLEFSAKTIRGAKNRLIDMGLIIPTALRSECDLWTNGRVCGEKYPDRCVRVCLDIAAIDARLEELYPDGLEENALFTFLKLPSGSFTADKELQVYVQNTPKSPSGEGDLSFIAGPSASAQTPSACDDADASTIDLLEVLAEVPLEVDVLDMLEALAADVNDEESVVAEPDAPEHEEEQFTPTRKSTGRGMVWHMAVEPPPANRWFQALAEKPVAMAALAALGHDSISARDARKWVAHMSDMSPVAFAYCVGGLSQRASSNRTVDALIRLVKAYVGRNEHNECYADMDSIDGCTDWSSNSKTFAPILDALQEAAGEYSRLGNLPLHMHNAGRYVTYLVKWTMRQYLYEPCEEADRVIAGLRRGVILVDDTREFEKTLTIELPIK